MTAPNGSAQRQLIDTVQKSFDCASECRGVALEAHGTGTALGDPVEVGAVIGALCKVGGEVACTSLKANMGHLEAVAGGAGVIALASLPLSDQSAPNSQLLRLNVHLVMLMTST